MKVTQAIETKCFISWLESHILNIENIYEKIYELLGLTYLDSEGY